MQAKPWKAKLLFQCSIGLAAAVLALALSGLVLDVSAGSPLVWLLFVLPLLWSLWLVYVVIDATGPIWRAIALWLLIDGAVLATLSLTTAVASRSSGPSGADFAFVIAFTPLVWPPILITRFVPVVGDALMAVLHGISLGPSQVSDWVQGSVLCAMASALFVSLVRLFWKG